MNNLKGVFYKILTFCSRLRVTNKIIAQQKTGMFRLRASTNLKFDVKALWNILLKAGLAPTFCDIFGPRLEKGWRFTADTTEWAEASIRAPSKVVSRLFAQRPDNNNDIWKASIHPSGLWVKAVWRFFFLETSISSYLGVEHSRHCLFLKKWSPRIYGCIQCQE